MKGSERERTRGVRGREVGKRGGEELMEVKNGGLRKKREHHHYVIVSKLG